MKTISDDTRRTMAAVAHGLQRGRACHEMVADAIRAAAEAVMPKRFRDAPESEGYKLRYRAALKKGLRAIRDGSAT